jgi:hypothetical protein
MSRLLRSLLVGIWGLLLIPLIAPVLKKWLEENIFADPASAATTAFRDATATQAFTGLLALGQQPWFRFALAFLTGVVVGVSLEWLSRKANERKAASLRSLGWKFRSLSDSIRIRTASPGWPDNVRDLKPAMLSLFLAGRRFDIWAPNERAFQLPDATFLCEYLKCVGKHLEDGDFAEARREALSWRPFLDHGARA